MEALQLLSRNEMKMIKGGEDPTWTCWCQSSGGCSVSIRQYENMWQMDTICEGDTESTPSSGTGTWGGSACGGTCAQPQSA